MYGSIKARRRRENFGDILLPESDFLLFLKNVFLFLDAKIPKFAACGGHYFRCQNSIKILLNFSGVKIQYKFIEFFRPRIIEFNTLFIEKKRLMGRGNLD